MLRCALSARNFQKEKYSSFWNHKMELLKVNTMLSAMLAQIYVILAITHCIVCPRNLHIHLIHTATDFALPIDSATITFESGVTNNTQCVDIFIMNDTSLESSEIFSVILSSSDPDVDIVNEVATIVIIDDDGMLIVHKVQY